MTYDARTSWHQTPSGSFSESSASTVTAMKSGGTATLVITRRGTDLLTYTNADGHVVETHSKDALELFNALSALDS